MRLDGRVGRQHYARAMENSGATSTIWPILMGATGRGPPATVVHVCLLIRQVWINSIRSGRDRPKAGCARGS